MDENSALGNVVRTVKISELCLLMLHSEMERNRHSEVTVHLTCFRHSLEKNEVPVSFC